ncbi:hypothetical protein DFH07DRAFT_756385, partial [Mycena maculata]
VGYTGCFCYVGITFQSTHKNVFSSHYTSKASTARRSGHAVLGIEAYIGNLPPKEGRLLYMACIDPHLMSGADVIIDVDDSALAHLEKVQHAFLRRLLGLGAYSMRVPLFTELGLIPVRYCRLILAMRYLAYLLRLTHAHYARAALEDSYNLYLEGCSGYWMDLTYALQNLHSPVVLPLLPQLTADTCDVLGKKVYISAMKYLDAEVTKSTRLYMLHGRLEPLDGEPAKKITTVLRHYLELVANAKHRKVLTCLLVSQHPLAVERMRYKSQYRWVDIPRDQRRCRFGCNEVETVEHAMFFCHESHGLDTCREFFVAAMGLTEPMVMSVSPWNATSVLKSLIFQRNTVCQVAKYAWKVFAIFDATPMVWPETEDIEGSNF